MDELYDYEGKVILLSFWKFNKDTCRSIATILESDFWNSYNKSQFQVLSLGAQQSLSYVIEWDSILDLTYPVLADSSGEVYFKYVGFGTPYHIIINDSLLIKYSSYGFNQDSLHYYINELKS